MRQRLLLLVFLSGLALIGMAAAKPLWSIMRPWLTGAATVNSVLAVIETDVIKRKPYLAGHQNFTRFTLIGYKQDRELHLYGFDTTWQHLDMWPFTGFSGTLGPKLREGDLQIPEGHYQVSGLNPNSAFHLSMKLNYPNAFDRKVAATEQRTQLGGDIFIHGSHLTVGCIPIGDTGIEELFYFIAQVGYEHGSVIIAPTQSHTQTDALTEHRPWVLDLYQVLSRDIQTITGRKHKAVPASSTK